MHFGPYVLQNWNLTKSFQSISLKWWAELLRLRCTGCVYYCGLSIFLIQWFFFFFFPLGPGRRNTADAPAFHQACSTMLFLPGCSSLSLTSPLNYCVCAHGSVTLNPGFILLSDRRHRRHVCHRDIWQAATLSAGKCNYSNEIKGEMGYLLSFQASTGINISVHLANTLLGGLVCSLRLAAAYFQYLSFGVTHVHFKMDPLHPLQYWFFLLRHILEPQFVGPLHTKGWPMPYYWDPPLLCINEEKLKMLPFLLWEEVYTLHCTSESLNGM